MLLYFTYCHCRGALHFQDYSASSGSINSFYGLQCRAMDGKESSETPHLASQDGVHIIEKPEGILAIQITYNTLMS